MKKRIIALALVVVCILGLVSVAQAGEFPLKDREYRAVDEYGKWRHSNRDNPLDWYNGWVDDQMVLDSHPQLDYADWEGKNWYDWWSINH